MPSGAAMKTTAGGRYTTRYAEAGQGTPLVLIHGVGMNAAFWGPHVEAFQDSYRVITYDILGHGGSDLPPEKASLDDYVAQLEELLQALNVRAAHVAGHSMGALVAVAFALKHPERVRRVVALNAVFDRTEAQRAGVAARAEILSNEDLEDNVEETIRRWFGDPVPESLSAQAQQAKAWLAGVDRVGYARAYRLFATCDRAFLGKLDALRVPALFLTGELDPNSTPEMSKAMARLSPHGRAEILPGQRHLMPYAAPALVDRSIAAFLTEHVRASGGEDAGLSTLESTR
jgi:pimeloyl-ACP methyl ester carboxylesterase